MKKPRMFAMSAKLNHGEVNPADAEVVVITHKNGDKMRLMLKKGRTKNRPLLIFDKTDNFLVYADRPSKRNRGNE